MRQEVMQRVKTYYKKKDFSMKRRILVTLLVAAMAAGAIGCGGKKDADDGSASSETTESPETEEKTDEQFDETEIQVFIAASLNTVMADLAEKYNETQPNVRVTFNADSSGTLMTQIKEGYACDLFFSAAQKQMDELEKDGFLVEGTRANVVNNQVVLLTYKGSDTKVTGLENLKDAESVALAGGSVPVGKYTRQALVNMGIIDETDAPDAITTEQVSAALGGVEISEQDNVSKVLEAVKNGSCEVGTTYYSDTYGFEDGVQILETVSYDLTGNVIYPISQIVNDEADDLQTRAAQDFYQFLLSDEAKEVFKSYYFDTDVE